MGEYVVYLIKYSGEKHPPFYIGSTSLLRLEKGYRGSVSSSEWKEIFKQELKENFNLYSYEILADFDTRLDALIAERELQIKFDVVNSDLFLNKALAFVEGKFGFSMKGKDNPMYGKKASDKTKEAISLANKGKVVVTENGTDYYRVTVENYHSDKHRYSTPKGDFNHSVAEACRERVRKGIHHFQNKKVIEKIQQVRKENGFSHSEVTKDKISAIAKERLKDWSNRKFHGSEDLWRLAPKLFDYFINNPQKEAKSWRKHLIQIWIDNFPILSGRNKWMFKIAAKFKNGWIPSEDKNFMDWLENESS